MANVKVFVHATDADRLTDRQEGQNLMPQIPFWGHKKAMLKEAYKPL